jgi:protein gp37
MMEPPGLLIENGGKCMQKTKIEWVDSTWNPITGCLHDCPYCYAKGIARRFSGYSKELVSEYGLGIQVYGGNAVISALEYPMLKHISNGETIAPYPFAFAPTFHRYRLDEPRKWKTSKTIFVGSMADMFGDWIPEEWIQEVFKACNAASWHRYLFLTKNPLQYEKLYKQGKLPIGDHFWYGVTTTKRMSNFYGNKELNAFLSIEPISENFLAWQLPPSVKLVIVGSETGNRKNKIIPERKWIEPIVYTCHDANIPVFMKDSLIPIVGEESMLRELPWGV